MLSLRAHHFWSIFFCLLLLMFTPGLGMAVENEPAIRKELRELSNGPVVVEWQKQVGARTRPSADRIFRVTDFKAVGDGITDSTAGIQAAIDACAKAGGGTVEFEQGDYVTGSLFIKSNVNFHVAKGVRLLGSTDDAKWPMVFTRAAGIEMNWTAAFLNVRDQQNVSITGEGEINARGKRWWDRFTDAVAGYEKKGLRWAADYDISRPHMMQIYQSRDVTVQGLTFIDSPFWTLHTVFSMHVTIDGCKVNNMVSGTKGPSTDGINIDSSAFVVVQNCDVDCNDDCYSFKAGMNADGLRVNLPVQYCMFRKNISRRGHGGITLGSDMSGGIRHCEAHDIKMLGTGNGIRFKSASVRGGLVEDISIHDISMDKVGNAFEMNLNWFPKFSYPKIPQDQPNVPEHWRTIAEPVPPEKGIPTWRDITVTNVKGNANRAMIAEGLPTSPILRLTLERVNIEAKRAGGIKRAKDWTIKDVTITTPDGKPIDIKDSEGVSFDQTKAR